MVNKEVGYYLTVNVKPMSLKNKEDRFLIHQLQYKGSLLDMENLRDKQILNEVR